MDEIKINPFKPMTATTKFGGYTGENKAYVVVIEGVSGENNEIWLTDDRKNYLRYPIPNNRFELTSYFTNEAKVWTAVIVEKSPTQGIIKKGHEFGIRIEKSIGLPTMIEIVPPAMQNLFEQMEIFLNEAERKLNSGELTGKTPEISIGTVKTVKSDEIAKVVKRGTKENPIFDFEIPQGKKGNVLYPTFDVVDNDLIMYASDDENLKFKINEKGELEVRY